MRKQQILMHNFALTDDWARVPIFDLSVKYYAHRDGRIISLPNKAYIERLEHYGKRLKYDTAKVIQDSPQKKADHSVRVTLVTGNHNGKSVNSSFLRHNVVWSAWHGDADMLTNTNAIKYKALSFIDGDHTNCALSNLEIRKDYCRCTGECAEAYKREYRWIIGKLISDIPSNLPIQSIQDIVSESFLLTVTRLYREGNNSHRIGKFWFLAAKRLMVDVITKNFPVNYYTRNLNIAYASG